MCQNNLFLDTRIKVDALCDFLKMNYYLYCRFLSANELEPDGFVSEILASLANIEEPKPTVMCKLIQALMYRIHPLPLTVSNLVRKVNAIIHEPTGTSDNPVKFMAGLSASIFLDATLENVQDIFRIRIRVSFIFAWFLCSYFSFHSQKKRYLLTPLNRLNKFSIIKHYFFHLFTIIGYIIC